MLNPNFHCAENDNSKQSNSSLNMNFWLHQSVRAINIGLKDLEPNCHLDFILSFHVSYKHVQEQYQKGSYFPLPQEVKKNIYAVPESNKVLKTKKEYIQASHHAKRISGKWRISQPISENNTTKMIRSYSHEYENRQYLDFGFNAPSRQFQFPKEELQSIKQAFKLQKMF